MCGESLEQSSKNTSHQCAGYLILPANEGRPTVTIGLICAIQRFQHDVFKGSSQQ